VPAIDLRVDKLEARVESLEGDIDDMNDRVGNVHDNTTRILAIAEGIRHTFIAIGGSAAFIGIVIGIYQAVHNAP
jgi:hypothetical protein